MGIWRSLQDEARDCGSGGFFAAEFLNGVMWATMAFLSVPNGQTEPIIFMFAVLIVILAMRNADRQQPAAGVAGGHAADHGGHHPAVLDVRRARLFRHGRPRVRRADLLHDHRPAASFHGAWRCSGCARKKDALIGELEQANRPVRRGRGGAPRRPIWPSPASWRRRATNSGPRSTPSSASQRCSRTRSSADTRCRPTRNIPGDIHRSGQHLLELIQRNPRPVAHRGGTLRTCTRKPCRCRARCRTATTS